jgi:hypothetical protein
VCCVTGAVLMATGVLCDSWCADGYWFAVWQLGGFVCRCRNFACMFSDSLSFASYFNYFAIYVILSKMYSYVISFRCIAKSNYWGEDTAYCLCHTISQLSSCNVSDCQSQLMLLFQHGSFHLIFATLKIFKFAFFLLLLSIPLSVPLH